MLVAIIAAPGLLGSQEAIRQSQSKEKREEHRARRCNLIATCVKSSISSREINGRPVVLRNGKLWIDTGTEDGAPLGHPYAGYYLPYPDSKHEGLVTTITDAAPIMNWVYVDKITHEAKYGVRVDAQPNLTGPFDCTRQDRRLTFDGWEGWCAVEEAPGLWALYFDVDDDGLRSKVAPGTRVLEIELSRKEKRFQKDTSARQQDQTTKRAVDAQEDAPVDQPLAAEALVSKPGVVTEAPVVQDEIPKPKPFRIPRSIFENPPPVLENSVFERPLTPPPAYSTTARPASPVSAATIAVAEPPRLPIVKTEQNPDTIASNHDSFGGAAQLRRSSSLLQANPLPLSRTPPNRSISPPISRSNPGSEKRTTPKLNRSSGTRTLAQAQMFEAMAAAQKPKNETQVGNSRRISRANSNADSGSDYSRDSQEMSGDIIPGSTTLPATSPTPAPLALASSKTKVPFRRTETQTVPRSTPAKEQAERPRTPSRQRAVTNPSDPAIFGTGPRPRPPAREPIRRPSKANDSPTSRPTVSRSSSRASSNGPGLPPQRRGTVTDRTGSPRAPVQQRGTALSSPRAPPQANRAATRTSLASTMTTGKGNKAMTTKMGEYRGRGRSATIQSPGQGSSKGMGGRKTTSALFREIDDLVSQDVGGSPSND
jgi:hypothetical protein